MRLKSLLVVALLLGTSVVHAAPRSPEAQIEALMKSLQAKQLDGVFQNFFAGTLTVQLKPTELKAMDGQAKGALEFFGPPTSYEIVETKALGNNLVRMKILSKHRDEIPLFWNVLFYKRNAQWEPLSIFFFDDPQKAGFF